MSIDSKLVSRLRMIYQQKDILKQQEDSIMKEIISKGNLENKEQVGEFVFEVKNTESILFAKNAYELIPSEKVSQIIQQKITKGEIDIESILRLLTKEEADVIKKGLEYNGAMKRNTAKKLLVARQKKT